MTLLPLIFKFSWKNIKCPMSKHWLQSKKGGGRRLGREKEKKRMGEEEGREGGRRGKEGKKERGERGGSGRLSQVAMHGSLG